MNKLGFAIKLASQGAGNAIECNKGQWTSKVVDIREYLKLFNGLQGTDNIVTFMSFDEGGCFLTQFRAISGRMGDFLSGWIYIPNTIDATGDEIMNTYNYVRNILSQSNLTDLKDDISSFFSKEFPSKEVSAQYSASKGQLYGVRFLGHYTLKEIVGEHRYQPYYSEYKAVFLLNKDDEVVIAKEAANIFIDLTNKEIVKTSTLIPPTSHQLDALGSGTKIYTIDGSEFNRPQLVKLDTKVPLFLSREGFENINLEVHVSSERQVVSFDSVEIIWKKRISASMFSIKDCNHKKIEERVHIFVNGKDISSQDALFSEEECLQAIIKVTAPDFETFEQRRSLLNEDKQIILNRKIRSFQAKVELTNGSQAEMTIESENLPSSHESPLKGYTYDEDYHGDKILKMDSWFIWKQRLWGFFAALVTVMLIIAFAAFDSWLDTHHFKVGLPPWEKNRTYEQSSQLEQQDSEEWTNSPESAIVVYLNSNAQWSREQLEKDPIAQGLYDMINEYRFTELVNVNIDGCDNIAKIKSLAQKMIDKNIVISGTYSQDGTITIQKWIDKVKSKIDETQSGIDDIDAGFNDNSADVAKKKAAEDVAKRKLDAETAKKKVDANATKKKADDANKKNKNNNPFDL